MSKKNAASPCNGGWPVWYDGKNINEILFCEEFLEAHPMKCVRGRLFTVDGVVEDEAEVSQQILEAVRCCVTSGLSKLVANLLASLKLQAYSPPLPIETDRIHVANGTYFMDGRFSPEKTYCNNRLTAAYRQDSPKPEKWLRFLSELLEPDDIFKSPTDSYAAMFDQMLADGIISTRGLKADAVKYGELIFDVNSAYFHNHGGYEYAKQFYTDAYKAAIEIVGGEQYILSAVMHADERNRAISEALGQDVYHYHLHVVYVPVVEKQILWSKRCKDKSLVATVKETIMQVSRSKKWESKVALDEQGNPLLNSKGKKVLRTSYSVLQDDF